MCHNAACVAVQHVHYAACAACAACARQCSAAHPLTRVADARELHRAHEALPVAGQPVLGGRLVVAARLVLAVQQALHAVVHAAHLRQAGQRRGARAASQSMACTRRVLCRVWRRRVLSAPRSCIAGNGRRRHASHSSGSCKRMRHGLLPCSAFAPGLGPPAAAPAPCRRCPRPAGAPRTAGARSCAAGSFCT